MSDLRFGRETLGRLDQTILREWLVTNGIGGYACGTLDGSLARRYHGLLIAALQPPVARTLLLAKLAERACIDGTWLDLDTNRWASGAIEPRGHLHLESFVLERTVPCWTWAIGDTRIEKRVWMEQGENTTYVQYRVTLARTSVTLSLRALVNARDSHATTPDASWDATIEDVSGGLRVVPRADAPALWLIAPGASVEPRRDPYRAFALPLETERGLDDVEDHLCAGEFTVTLEPGEAFTLIASTRHDAGPRTGPLALTTALQRRRAHEKRLLDAWRKVHGRRAQQAPPWIERLVLAADQFIVERTSAGDAKGRSVIAGYPWFSDWGRDTMIALPGLALTTGRPRLARAILAQFARHLSQGMLPNCFPDTGEPPEYNTVDAALWLFQAVRAYHDATDDDAFLAGVFPALEDIGAWYERGTRFGIAVDPHDALVRQGADGVALTWMDARVDDWVVTPRKGKPVEINALWYGALVSLARFATRLGRPAKAYADLARRVANSFDKFWNADAGCLYDVLDGAHGPDASIRPNQIFAVSLPDSPLSAGRRRAVVDVAGRHLLTSHGLRSLSPTDPAYRGRFSGNRRFRDGAYHEGTVWTWLLPHYALAHFRAYRDRGAALALLEPLALLHETYGVGSLPEIADGDPPHAPHGCFAQAWSVGETLRVWHALNVAKPAAKRKTATRRATPMKSN